TAAVSRRPERDRLPAGLATGGPQITISKRNWSDLFACKWLRALDLNQRPNTPTGVSLLTYGSLPQRSADRRAQGNTGATMRCDSSISGPIRLQSCLRAARNRTVANSNKGDGEVKVR